MNWIKVDKNGREICSFEDVSFPFGVWLDEYDKMDANVLPCHWHEAIEYAYVVSGKIEMMIGDLTVTLNRGECAFINANTLHSGKRLKSGEETFVYAICFSPDILSGDAQGTVYKKYFQPINSKNIGCKIDRLTPDGGRLLDLLERIRHMNAADYGYELNAMSAIAELWLKTINYINANRTVTISKNSDWKNNTIKKMILYVQNHYQENISIDTLASYAHISRSECFRCFKNYTGKTPVDFINDHRLAVAENLLCCTDAPIAEIYISCGFASQSYFGKLFKQRYGVSPLKIRNSRSKQENKI